MTPKIRVMIVDDSATARVILSKHLATDPEIEVVGWARDGVEALDKIKTLRPDVVTLDVEMPRMDGLQALEHVMRESPTPIVMVSALTREGAQITLRALELGAIDFVLKPTRGGVRVLREVTDELCSKVRAAARANVLASVAAAHESKVRPRMAPPTKSISAWQDNAVVIASSTGGPQALSSVLASLPADTAVPILVVQHMPEGLTGPLAERLNELGPLRVEEAQSGSKLVPGQVLVAPGNQHMTLAGSGEVRLNNGARECGVRPSANVTMESVAQVYGAATVGVVLTGMGRDGTRGAGLIRAAGGKVIVQDEPSCVVYGMPKSVVRAGYADRVVPLPRIASEMVRMCGTRPQREEARA
jgi:two-component system chemotaxis response regulator CheB